jgi:hypothetical protein
MTPSSAGTQQPSGIRSTECISLSLSRGSQLSLWDTPNTGSVKPTLPVAIVPATTKIEGKCAKCGDEVSHYIQSMTGRLEEWCSTCRVSTIIERRRMPRE